MSAGYPEPEPRAEGEPEGEPVNPEGEGETTPNPATLVHQYASAAEIILPAISLNLIIITALLLVSCATQKRWWRKKFRLTSSAQRMKQLEEDIPHESDIQEILTHADKEAIDTFLCYFNQPYYLFSISLPAVISLIICPFALYLYEPLTEIFWPKEYFATTPKINDVISCFLTPAGLVYAIAFGFAFQEAQTKQQLMTQSVCKQMSCLVQIVMLTFVVDELDVPQKQALLRHLKNEVIDWMKSLIGIVRQDTADCLHGNLFSAIQLLSDAMRQCGNISLLPKLSEVVMELDSLMSSRVKHAHSSMPLVQWLFLEVLGFISFFGILLLRADSYRLELTMAILTVFSISAFCYVLADLDSPFHGAFRVPMDMLIKFLYHLEEANIEVAKGIPKHRRGTKYSIKP